MATIEKKDLGRNDPCHCGSGKKYKTCHLEKDEAAGRKARTKAAETAEAAPEAEAPAEGTPQKAAATPKPSTRQPWKGRQDSRGFQNTKAHIPRRSGGS